MSIYLDLVCPDCAWREACSLEAMADWLRRARKLRAGSEPEPEIVEELFRAAAGEFRCPECGRKGLTTAASDDDLADWPESVLCQSCRKPIAPERIAAVPGTRLCAACQQDDEAGRGRQEIEYCPCCGAPMELRLSRSRGITRYVLTCTASPPCRQKGPP